MEKSSTITMGVYLMHQIPSAFNNAAALPGLSSNTSRPGQIALASAAFMPFLYSPASGERTYSSNHIASMIGRGKNKRQGFKFRAADVLPVGQQVAEPYRYITLLHDLSNLPFLHFRPCLVCFFFGDLPEAITRPFHHPAARIAATHF
jgi:hypothetical protein